MDCSMLGLPVHPISQRLLKLVSLEWGCYPIISSSVVPFSSCPQSFPESGSFQMSQLFTKRWPKYWSFSFNISPSYEYSGLISFRMDWLDLLAVQGTLKSLLQHHSSKASILRCSALLVSSNLWQFFSHSCPSWLLTFMKNSSQLLYRMSLTFFSCLIILLTRIIYWGFTKYQAQCWALCHLFK